MTTMHHYTKIQHPIPTGSTILVELFGGQRVEGVVDNYEENIKNGRPGYDLTNCSDGHEHWCYASQVRAIFKR